MTSGKKSRLFYHISYLLATALLFISVCISLSCNRKKHLFSRLPEERTRISFQNLINETDSFNILDYLYFYNGGGVAVGDINNDGLDDIYFSSNQGSNKLYLNRGDFRFEDITDKAGVKGKGNWKTGVTLADVNSDGLLDIYVCEVGKYNSLHGRNELFINNGNLTFTERAREFGLDAEGFNTQASFFDYDKDGDLDMFLVNHSVHSTDTYVDSSSRSIPNDVSGDKLFRCDKEGDRIFFKEVTREAGIYSGIIGYGLNVVVGDFNNDHWDDIYVSNDFHENDYYYLNNKNGTFRETNRNAFGHESRFSMGSDAGDINNDGWLDLITLDMLPADEKVLKSSVSDDPLDIYDFKMRKGYHHQYSKNCLQLNMYAGERFSDLGLFSGVAATDWSWSPLLADYDNDGIRDLFITNGILRRPNDLDYLKFISSPAIYEQLQKGKSSDKSIITKMPEGKSSNYIFQGTPDLRFIDQSRSWGFDHPGYSNGASYADLDNDGDLDLIINNINEPAGIYRNNARDQLQSHYLNIRLKGINPNTFAYGAKVIAKIDGRIQMNYVTATRGFESSSASRLHFGLGSSTRIDTLWVIWPNQQMETLTNIKADQHLIIQQKKSGTPTTVVPPVLSNTLLRNYTDSIVIRYRHSENRFVDFNTQPLMPHEVSTQGPKTAVADLNDDGLDDLFVCGARGQPGKLFIQNTNGKFISTNERTFSADSSCEDVDAIFFDADGDRDNDLYVVSGGNEFSGNAIQLLDRLYINNGKGTFSKSSSLPSIYENKSVAVAEDIDHDKDMDLFVGGRIVAGRYGEAPVSYILINDGRGNFSIAPEKIAPGLTNIGMVTDAVWVDIDNDTWKELIVVGEWMPISVFKNIKGILTNNTKELHLENTHGLWTTVLSSDLDQDGFDDLLVGNLGENSKLKASESIPLHLYVGDLDNNGVNEQVLAVAAKGEYFSFLGKEEIEKLIPGVIRKKYPDYKSMAGESVKGIFGSGLSRLKKLSANTLASVIVKNKGGNLKITRLPSEVQWSPVFSFCTDDFNQDGKKDILSAGNFFGVTPYEGRYDAGYGNILLSSGSSFKSISPLHSGLIVDGEVRDIKKLRTANNATMLAICRNNNTILFYKSSADQSEEAESLPH